MYFFDEKYNNKKYIKLDDNHYSIQNMSREYSKTCILKLNNVYKNPFKEMSKCVTIKWKNMNLQHQYIT